MSERGIHDEPEPRFDFSRPEVGRLHRLQRFDIPLIGGIEPSRSLGSNKFRANVAAEIPVGSLPRAAFRIPVSKGAQFVLQIRGGLAGQRLHARPIDLAGFIERHE